MSAADRPPLVEASESVPRTGKKRYAVFALLVIVAIVLGWRRVRTKPVASDASPSEIES